MMVNGTKVSLDEQWDFHGFHHQRLGLNMVYSHGLQSWFTVQYLSKMGTFGEIMQLQGKSLPDTGEIPGEFPTFSGVARKTSMCVHKHTHISISTYLYLCTYVCMYLSIHPSIYLCMTVMQCHAMQCNGMYMYVCMYACMHACMYVCMCVCLCLRVENRPSVLGIFKYVPWGGVGWGNNVHVLARSNDVTPRHVHLHVRTYVMQM